MRTLIATIFVLTGTAAQAAAPFPLVLSSAPDRKAETDDDWVKMVPVVQVLETGGDCQSPVFIDQRISPDGRYAYQEVCRWVTSDLIVRVDLATGERRSLGGANSLSIIRNGTYQGDLIVEHHEYREGGEGGSFDPAYVMTPDGEKLLMIPNSDVGDFSDATASWLSEHNWNAW